MADLIPLRPRPMLKANELQIGRGEEEPDEDLAGRNHTALQTLTGSVADIFVLVEPGLVDSHPFEVDMFTFRFIPFVDSKTNTLVALGAPICRRDWNRSTERDGPNPNTLSSKTKKV